MTCAVRHLFRYVDAERLHHWLHSRLNRLGRRLDLALKRFLEVRAMLASNLNFRLRPKVRRHWLPQKLILSLTSYPPRFPTLAPTLRCLLSQSVQPDRIILWVATEDEAQLPEKVLALRKFGLEIRTTRDIGPFTKIIPTLEAFPDAIIVTADDDLYYRRTWLEELIRGWSGSGKEIVCHRAHEITFDESGLPKSYREWNGETTIGRRLGVLFPTGVGGVLYPPGSLSPCVSDVARFMNVCPRNDDIWLFWMGQLAGAEVHNLASGFRLVNWPSSQDHALYNSNVLENQNDAQLANMIREFGWPPGSKARQSIECEDARRQNCADS